MDLIFIWLHVLGLVVWIGSILAVGLTVASPLGEPKLRGQMALAIYTRLAVPSFLVAFVFGVARLAKDHRYYLKEHHWMHGKLLFAVAVIALHHVLGGRARKLAQGTVQTPGPAGTLTVVLAVCAAAAAFIAINKIPD